MARSLSLMLQIVVGWVVGDGVGATGAGVGFGVWLEEGEKVSLILSGFKVGVGVGVGVGFGDGRRVSVGLSGFTVRSVDGLGDG